RPRIGVMPQGGGAYPGVRADEMLRLVASCAANPLDPAWLLDVLGLDSVRRTPFKRLSGGQQQRLSLACALIGRPELVFLDEPTAGMDPQARRLVWELVRALRSDGVGVLLTTHLMAEAEALADQVVIIDRGRVAAQGSPAELTATTADKQRLTFQTRAGLPLAGLVAALPVGCAVAELTAGDYEVTGPITPHVVSTVTAWCAQEGVLAQALQVATRSLEDVFLDLTGRELRS
ncbi:MAG TPA: ABC transporter ATP-binding protein, partial [Pseudonocardiaceae bacterium]